MEEEDKEEEEEEEDDERMGSLEQWLESHQVHGCVRNELPDIADSEQTNAA